MDTSEHLALRAGRHLIQDMLDKRRPATPVKFVPIESWADDRVMSQWYRIAIEMSDCRQFTLGAVEVSAYAFIHGGRHWFVDRQEWFTPLQRSACQPVPQIQSDSQTAYRRTVEAML